MERCIGERRRVSDPIVSSSGRYATPFAGYKSPMPELPEVETVARDLRPLLVGRTLVGLTRSRKALRRPGRRPGRRSCRPAGRGGPPAGQVAPRWRLDSGAFLMVHLGMTGRFTVVAAGDPREPHTHLVFRLDNAQELRFRDARRFGSVDLLPGPGELEAFLATRPGAGAVGPEARRRSGRRLKDDPAGDQGGPAGPDGRGGRRQHLCRRGTLCRPNRPPAAGKRPATGRGGSPLHAVRDVLDRAIEAAGLDDPRLRRRLRAAGGYQDEFRRSTAEQASRARGAADAASQSGPHFGRSAGAQPQLSASHCQRCSEVEDADSDRGRTTAGRPLTTRPQTTPTMSYRAFKRLLGETGLERKCRFLFGAFILLLITLCFWRYARQTEGLAYDQIDTTGRLLVVAASWPSATSEPEPREADQTSSSSRSETTGRTHLQRVPVQGASRAGRTAAGAQARSGDEVAVRQQARRRPDTRRGQANQRPREVRSTTTARSVPGSPASAVTTDRAAVGQASRPPLSRAT